MIAGSVSESVNSCVMIMQEVMGHVHVVACSKP